MFVENPLETTPMDINTLPNRTTFRAVNRLHKMLLTGAEDIIFKNLIRPVLMLVQHIYYMTIDNNTLYPKAIKSYMNPPVVI